MTSMIRCPIPVANAITTKKTITAQVLEPFFRTVFVTRRRSCAWSRAVFRAAPRPEYCEAIGAAGATAFGAADPIDCGWVAWNDSRSTCADCPGMLLRNMAATSVADTDIPCQVNGRGPGGFADCGPVPRRLVGALGAIARGCPGAGWAARWTAGRGWAGRPAVLVGRCAAGTGPAGRCHVCPGRGGFCRAAPRWLGAGRPGSARTLTLCAALGRITRGTTTGTRSTGIGADSASGYTSSTGIMMDGSAVPSDPLSASVNRWSVPRVASKAAVMPRS